MKHLILTLLLATIAPLCARPTPLPSPTPVPETTPENDMARFLAGLPVWEGSPLARIQRRSEYAPYRKRMGELWYHYNVTFFEPMRTWSRDTLAPRIDTSLPLVYFFGGPDAVNMLALFPDTPLYLMSGLEPVGQIAEVAEMDAIGEELTHFRQSVEGVLSYGYFITKDMKEQLDRAAFRGVLPLLYVAIALTGGDITSTVIFEITKDGRSVATGEGGEGAAPAVRVNFRNKSGTIQTIAYCQANLSNESLAANPAPLKWVLSFGKPNNTYLKSASYLMHEGSFSTVRKFLLDHSQAILQDDSGIPFKAFSPERWSISLFGVYNETLDIFKKYHQPDLLAAFQTGDAQPLPFGTGYKFEKGQSNLLLATRGAQASSLWREAERAQSNEARESESREQKSPDAPISSSVPRVHARDEAPTPPLLPYRPEHSTPTPTPNTPSPSSTPSPPRIEPPTIIIGGGEDT